MAAAIVREPTLRERRAGEIGNAKRLLRGRAEMLGVEMPATFYGARRIESGRQSGQHFARYCGTEAGFYVEDERNMKDLFSVEIGGRRKRIHMIWIFGPTTAEVRQYEADMGMERRAAKGVADDELKLAKLPNRIFELIYANPELITGIEEFLLNAYVCAATFADWNTLPQGISVAGNSSHMAATHPQYREREGNDGLGIEIGIPLIEDMLKGLRYRTWWLDTHLLVTFVHEIVHLQRYGNDPFKSDVHSYAIEIFAGENSLFSLVKSVNAMLWERWRMEQNGHPRFRDSYAWQAHKGSIIAANELARYNRGIAGLFAGDRNPFKLRAASHFVNLIRDSDISRAVDNGFVEWVLSLDNHEIVDAYRTAEVLRS